VNGGSYNLGGPRCTLRELADLLVRLHGSGSYQVREFPREAKKIDIGSYFADDSRFRSTCPWEPRVSLPEGLTRTLAYYGQYLPEYL
jgi:UDP-glucose 4-epimerase